MRTALLTLLVAISLGANAQSDREIAALNKLFWHYHPNADAQYTVIKSGRLFTSFSATDSITGKTKLMMNVASLNSIKSVEKAILSFEDPTTKTREEYVVLRISATWLKAHAVEKADFRFSDESMGANFDFSVSGRYYKLGNQFERVGYWDVIICSTEEKVPEDIMLAMVEVLKKMAGLAHASYTKVFDAAGTIAPYKEGVASTDALHGKWEAFGFSPTLSFESVLNDKERWKSKEAEMYRDRLRAQSDYYLQFDSKSKMFQSPSVESGVYSVDAIWERFEIKKDGEVKLAFNHVWIYEPQENCRCGDGVYLVIPGFIEDFDIYFKLKR